MKTGKVLLAHGGGGQLSDDLIRNYILPEISEEKFVELNDSAKLDFESSSLCFTTDSYVVKPLFFNGGDIGKLAVCGTVNDLAVQGATPMVLSLSLIIEVGFELETLKKILSSIGSEAKKNNVKIVTGDTKTVEAGAADKIFINTAGIGLRLPGVDLGFNHIKAGDKIICSGTIGDHGLTIISQRQGIEFQSKLKSDCAGLGGLTCELLKKYANEIKFMRDPTRGGLAATFNDIAHQSNLSVNIRQADIPVNPTAQAAADILGFDILNIANEGKFIAIVSPVAADDCLNMCKKHTLGKNAAIIGEIVENKDVATVELETSFGGRRIIPMPYGNELPRIC